MKVRTRFAPSPTGYLHVGGVRTALFAYIYAKQNNGDFILRIEDTDKSREVSGSVEHIQESLSWLGIKWDEGPSVDGPHGPYQQSQRLDIYKQWADKLLASGHAYVDTYTKEQLNQLRLQATDSKQAFLFRNHRPTEQETPDDWYGKYPLRFKINDLTTTNWHDEVWGDLSAGAESLDDFVLIKADGYPTYNFAHVIDDHLMEVSHVMRGEEFLPSVPNFIALHNALGFALPKFATMPYILGPDGKKKLSKRDGAKDILEYKQDGILPEAMFNFIASLGWNDGTEQEVYSPDEIIERFSLQRIHKKGAQFDVSKLNWLNWQHLKTRLEANPEQVENITGLNVSAGPLSLALSKANSLDSLKEQLQIFTSRPAFKLSDENLQLVTTDLDASTAVNYLKSAAEVLNNCQFAAESVEAALRSDMEELGAQPRAYLNLIRWVISGQKVSPNLFAMIVALGKDETLARLRGAVDEV